MSDRERLLEAFTELEELGWVARANYMDCMECGFQACWEEVQILQSQEVTVTGMVFWSNQDDEVAFGYFEEGADGVEGEGWERFNLGDDMLAPLFLGWDDFSDGHGEPVVEALRRAKFIVTPPSDDTQRIEVTTTQLVNAAGSRGKLAGSMAG
jgi:hypothetical protein